MDKEKDILRRLQRLEEEVFAGGRQDSLVPQGVDLSAQDLESEPSLETTMGQVANAMKGIRAHYREDDHVVVQAILHQQTSQMDIQTTSLHTLREEENDQDIVAMCSVLASPQRIAILRLLSEKALSSGQLSQGMDLAGGHLHHHLRDLKAKGFVDKQVDRSYKLTRFGLNAYLTVAALNRRGRYTSMEEMRHDQ